MVKASVIGLGMMGSTLARLLLQGGHRTSVWNRTSAKTDALVRNGAIFAPSVAAAVDASEVVVICVHDYPAANAILRTKEVASALAGRLLIQLTTGSPQDARDMENWAHEHGADYLDGAIQAAPSQMGAPETPILLSGSAAAFRRGEAILKLFGGNITYLGERIGAAATLDAATLSCIYGTLLGFFHGARICEAERFGVKSYASILAGIMPTFGAFLKHEGAVIESNNYVASESPLTISVAATARLEQAARTAGINAEVPAFMADLLQRTAAAGYADEELAAVFKLLRDTPQRR